MKPGRLMAWAVAGLLVGLLALPAAAEDVTNAKDHPLFSRLPRFEITHYEHNYDAVEFPSGPETSLTLEGQKTYLEYWLGDGSPRPSSLQVIRNYANAVKKLGGEAVHENVAGADTRQGVYKLSRGGKEIWLWVLPLNDGEGYRLTVLEVGQMAQEITTGELMNALEKDGRVALYLNFDTNKYALKPEARPVIEKVVALLKEHPDLRLSVDGHTDDQGDPQRNKLLSEQRAQAVVKALARAGVDPARLSARGFGQEVPLTGNHDEEGRAQNRRVELVRH